MKTQQKQNLRRLSYSYQIDSTWYNLFVNETLEMLNDLTAIENKTKNDNN